MSARLSSLRFAATLLFALVMALAAGFASAQTTYTWDGGGGNNLWSTGANWVGDAAPSRNNSTFLTFAGSARLSPFNDAADWQQIAGMTFASGASGFQIQGSAIGFVNGSGEQVITQNSATTQEITNTFSFSPNQNSRINLNAGDLLISSGNVYQDVTSAAARQIYIDGSDSTRRTVTFSGNVRNSGSGQDADLVILANKRVLVTGTLLNGSGNDASVFVNNGVLQFSGAGAMTGGRPAIGDTSGSGSAAVWLDTAGTIFARQLELRNGSSGRRTVGGLNTSGTVTFSGEFVGNAGSYDLAAATGGATVFSGARNYNATVVVNRPDGGTAYGGTVILSGTTSSSFGTALHAGTLQFSDWNQLGSDYFEFDAASGDSGSLRYTGGSVTTTRTLWLDNTGITRAAIDVSQAGTTLTWNPGGGTRNQNLTKTGPGWLFFGGGITGGTVGVEAGLMVLSASNSYSGGTVVSGGTLEVSAGGSEGGSPAALGTGTVSIASGAQVKFWLSASASNTIANPFSLAGGTLHTTDGYNTYSGRVTLASGASTVSAQYEDTITLSGGLAGSGAVLFTQSGGTGSYAAPTYVLSGTGANTGSVRVNGSSGGGVTKLQLANVNALQSATLDLATADTGTVQFTVAGNNTYALGGLQGSRSLAFGANSLSVGGNGQSTTYSGDLSGSGLVTKVGGGTLTLSGANTNSGGVALNAGTLALGSAGALGSSGTIAFGGGTLEYSASNTTDYSPRFSTAASQQYRIDTNGQGVTLGSNLTSVGGTLTKLGSGTLTLGGANAYDGGTTVSAGRLVGTTASVQGDIVNNAEVEFDVDDSHVNQYLGTMSGSGALIKSGIGELWLMATNSYTGGTVVTAGRLMGGTDGIQGAIANAAVVEFGMDTDGTYAGAMSGAGSLVKSGEGILTVTGSNSFTGGVSLNGGALALGSAAAIGPSGTISFGGGTLRYSSANTTDYSSRFSNEVGQAYRIDTNGQSVSLASNLTSSAGALTKLGSGTLTVAGNNTYDNGTAIDAGVLVLGSSGALGSAGTVSFGGGTLRFSSANTTDYSTRFSADPGQQYRIDTNGQSVSLGSNLTSEGGTLTTLGSGTLTVSGNNSYDGGTAINGGVLALGSAGALGSTGTLSFGGGTLRFSPANTTDYSARFATAANQPFRIDTNGQSVTLASNMTSSGSGSLTKLGAGTLTLSGTNFIYGTITIDDGVLAVASIGAFQTASQISFNGGTLQYASSSFSDYSSRFSNAAGQQYRVDTNGYTVHYLSPLTSSGGSFTKLGAGTLQLLGTNSYDGGTTVSGGTLLGTTASIKGNVVNDAQVYFSMSTTGTYAGTMSGTGSLYVSASAPLVLTGTNTYSGGTFINSGRVVGTTSGVQGAIQNYGIVEFAQAATGTYSSVMSGTGRLEKSGAGNLVVTATNTYTGATTVAAGRLSVNGRLANTAVTVQNGAELGGSGRITGSVLVAAGGTLAPGNSIESLGVGATTFSGTSTFAYEYDSSASLAVGGDLLAVSGNLSIASGALVTFADIAGSPQAFALGTSFAMINYSGTWDGGTLTYGETTLFDGATFTVGSQQWQIDYNRTSSAGLSNFTGDYLPGSSFVAITAVPEPSTIVLAAVGLVLGAGLVRRSRRRARAA